METGSDCSQNLCQWSTAPLESTLHTDSDAGSRPAQFTQCDTDQCHTHLNSLRFVSVCVCVCLCVFVSV